MGWPKKDEGLRLYFERKTKSYLILDPEKNYGKYCYSGVAEVMTNNDPDNPCLGTTEISGDHLYHHCRRASWVELPPVWQNALAQWIEGKPEDYRGLWRINEMEEYLIVRDTPFKDLPLLINKEWKSKFCQKLYWKRLKNIPI